MHQRRRRSVPVDFELPDIAQTKDVGRAVDAVLAAVAGGRLTPAEGRTIMQFVMVKAALLKGPGA